MKRLLALLLLCAATAWAADGAGFRISGGHLAGGPLPVTDVDATATPKLFGQPVYVDGGYLMIDIGTGLPSLRLAKDGTEEARILADADSIAIYNPAANKTPLYCNVESGTNGFCILANPYVRDTDSYRIGDPTCLAELRHSSGSDCLYSDNDCSGTMNGSEGCSGDDVPDAGDYGTLALIGAITSVGLTTTLSDDIVTPAKVGDGDFGDFTVSGNVAGIDTGSLSGPEIAGTATVNLGGGGTLEIPNSTTLPATCAVGEMYMDTDATTGQRLYACQATNTWVLQGDGGGSGDVTDVGNCTTGACFTGASGTTLTFNATGSPAISIDTIAGLSTLHSEGYYASQMGASYYPNSFVRVGSDVTVEATGNIKLGTVNTNTTEMYRFSAVGSLASGVGVMDHTLTRGVDGAGDEYTIFRDGTGGAGGIMAADRSTGTQFCRDWYDPTGGGGAGTLDFSLCRTGTDAVELDAVLHSTKRQCDGWGSIARYSAGHTGNTYFEVIYHGVGSSTTESLVQQPTPEATLYFHSLYVRAGPAPDNGAGVQSWTVTLRDDGADTALTCTVSEADTSCVDTTNIVSVAAHSQIAIEVTPSGTPYTPSGIDVSWCTTP